ncbi:MAG: TetR family transcriptional regulator [Micrococcales bacterium]|nr:TetR family transcriptional regulator [Micrococcales bacterium]
MEERRKPGPRRQPTRQRVLTIAREHAIRHGWRQARVQDIAKEAGISRPTLYKDFPSKQALGEALWVDQVENFLGDLMAVLASREGEGLREAARAAVEYALGEAQNGPFLRAVLTEDTDGEGLLPMLTGGPSVVTMASDALTPWFLAHYPTYERRRVSFALAVAVRVTISFLARPAQISNEEIAEEIADMLVRYVEPPETP